jgi:adenine phosphoribosyltransferase
LNRFDHERIKGLIRDIPDYPVKGVIFRDLTPLFKDVEAFRIVIEELYDRLKDKDVDIIAAIEARGFIVGAPLAIKFGAGFVPLRKPGKLPWKKRSITYQLEYGEEALEVHEDAVSKGMKVLLIDDLLATGGTASSAAKLLEGMGAEVVGMGFIVELAYLHGRDKISGYDVESLVVYD